MFFECEVECWSWQVFHTEDYKFYSLLYEKKYGCKDAFAKYLRNTTVIFNDNKNVYHKFCNTSEFLIKYRHLLLNKNI